MRTTIFLVLFLGQFAEAFAATILSGREARAVLQMHNSYRASVGVPKLKTDTTVAKSALKWATSLKNRNCPLEHSSAKERSGYGENLYAQWATPGFRFNPSEGVQIWGDEGTDYSYATNTCATGKVCGHYTQVVWRETTKVGCALTQCLTNGNQIDILVCQYGPAGNYMGMKPY
jgi:pathogenesis-related protein 1